VAAKRARIVDQLVTEAVGLGADTIQVEYRDGYEEICVLKGGVGFDREMAECRPAGGRTTQRAPRPPEEAGDGDHPRRSVRDPHPGL
jgi:hypothetical protein